MLALMKKEEELLYTRKKNNGRHLSVQGTEKHMTLNIKEELLEAISKEIGGHQVTLLVT